jgi:hypothetical protein
MRFDVLTAMKMSISVFWAVTPCGLVGRYQRFGGIYCLHVQDAETQKTNIDSKYIYFNELFLEIAEWTEDNYETTSITGGCPLACVC